MSESQVLKKLASDIEDRLSEVQLELSELSLERTRLEAALLAIGVTSVRTRIEPDPKVTMQEDKLTEAQQLILRTLRALGGERTAGELAHATNFQISSSYVYGIMNSLVRYGLAQHVTVALDEPKRWEAVPRG